LAEALVELVILKLVDMAIFWHTIREEQCVGVLERWCASCAVTELASARMRRRIRSIVDFGLWMR
jgi:hypothetical protein